MRNPHYLQHEVDDDHNSGAVMNALFPGGELDVGIGVPGPVADEDEPEDVDDEGADEDGDDDDLLVLVSLTRM